MFLTEITLVTILRLACPPEEEDGTVVRHNVDVCDNQAPIIGEGLPSLMRQSSAVNGVAVVVHTGLHGKVTGESLLALRSRTADYQNSQFTSFMQGPLLSKAPLGPCTIALMIAWHSSGSLLTGSSTCTISLT